MVEIQIFSSTINIQIRRIQRKKKPKRRNPFDDSARPTITQQLQLTIIQKALNGFLNAIGMSVIRWQPSRYDASPRDAL